MSSIHVQSKHLSAIQPGELTVDYSVNGDRILRYKIDFSHKALNVHKALSAPELVILQNKVDALIATWDVKYDEHLKRGHLYNEKSRADQATLDASQALGNVRQLLKQGIGKCAAVDWEQLKDRTPFSKIFKPEPEPVRPIETQEPVFSAPTISFWEKLFGKAKYKVLQAEETHAQAILQWSSKNKEREAQYNLRLNEWQRRTETFRSHFEAEKKKFHAEQTADNSKIDDLAQSVMLGEEQAIIDQMTLVLDKSDYGELFEKSFDIEYEVEQKTLLVQYQLPSPDAMPQVKAVRFIKATGEIKESLISERERQSNFDSACYQICLRTLYEIFDADVHKHIDRVLFNGNTCYIDKSTGKEVDVCIMSLLVDRKQFCEIDLSRIDPKACFKSLKGVSASSLSALAPIPPILKLNKDDKRFIDGRDAIENISPATNLAAMDWEDFEHLVRQVFEKEFASRGGEVKITQSSSDGGVDAIAFDPDPITGGKIVIQAKRYTKTVGVSAVRDLYGTMQHETASRGILVTTADFGPDAHKFSAGKPITLMTGANLLHMLERQGIAAKIDLREARKVLNLRN